jgi:hypothetical protein
MDSLSHWDFASQFSGQVAAALILGIDPNNLDPSLPNLSRVKVVYDEMALHYEHALKRRYHEALNIYPEDPQEIEASIPFELPSAALEKLHSHWSSCEEDNPFTEWLINNHVTSFETQHFSRQTIADWLKATNKASFYEFNLDAQHQDRSPSGHWPWGNHHTENLEHLEAAARRFWINYDPDDISTAPTNKEISDWLIESRAVSGKLAENIASILRPEGLRTGPRK